uniref:CARDB domain-containing protein n=1 Tax=Amphimedon queenslandica TaxID=400682 RepID=A0A1X7THF7_AMPQE
PPSVVINEVNISINNNNLLIDASVTDNGSAPASGLTFNITSNYSNSNYGNTVSFGSPIVNATRSLNGLIVTQYAQLLELLGGSGDYELYLTIGAFNDIGINNNLYNTTFTVP